MAATYIGTSINESPVIVMKAGEELKNARGIALSIKDGALVKPEAGKNAIGISIIETDETVEKGSDVDIQIKDIGKWTAGAAVTAGTELATDENGKAVEAKPGDFIIGIALNSAEKEGTWLKVQITKSGYKA